MVIDQFIAPSARFFIELKLDVAAAREIVCVLIDVAAFTTDTACGLAFASAIHRYVRVLQDVDAAFELQSVFGTNREKCPSAFASRKREALRVNIQIFG